MAWLAGYSKRKPLVITGGASGAQTDFQLKLTVAYSAAMQGDFDDLRFAQADGTTLVDAWLESKVDDTSAVPWVEFPTTPANTVEQTYYMYYGNGAAASDWDFDNKFIFGDPFDNAALNTTRWPTVDGNPTYSIDATNHYIEITDMDAEDVYGRGFHSKTISLPTEWIIEDAYGSDGFGMYHNSSTAGDVFQGLFSLHHTDWGSWSADAGIGWFMIGDHYVSYTWVRNQAGVGGAADYDSGALTPSLPITYLIKMWKSSGNIHITQNGVERVNEANSETPDRIHLGIRRPVSYSFGTKRFYAFKARKYAANPPTYAFGAEESVGHPTMRRWGGIPGMQYTGRRSW